MKSSNLGARIVSAVLPVIEALENRRLLSVPPPIAVQYPAIAPGAASAPFPQLNPGTTNSGDEQLEASVNGGGITAILAQVQDFAKPASLTNGQYGNTALRLYVRSGSGPWYEQDINTAFDGLPDTYYDLNLQQTVKAARKDDQIVMDPQHNIYVLSSSDTSYKLRIDRITYANLQAMASGQAITIDQSKDV